MTKDPVVTLLTKRAKIMRRIDACPEEEDETGASALSELDTRFALQRTTTPLGKALAAAFLEHELREFLRHAPDVQRNVIIACVEILREGLPEIPAEIAKILERQ